MSKRPNYHTSEKKGQTKIALYERIRQMLAIERVCTRFHLVAQRLRSRYENRETFVVSDENDVQDLLQALLTIEFDDIRPLEWTPSYTTGKPRRDFLLKLEQIVVMAKLANANFETMVLTEQLRIDVEHYQQFPECKTLVCFIYDPERQIPEPRKVENNLSGEQNGFNIRVFIAPKG